MRSHDVDHIQESGSRQECLRSGDRDLNRQNKESKEDGGPSYQKGFGQFTARPFQDILDANHRGLETLLELGQEFKTRTRY